MSAEPSRFKRVRHPLAAILSVAGIVVGAVAAVSTPASAAGDELVATTNFECVMSSFPAYTWNGEITLSALRPADSTTVTVSASFSQMSGVAPVPLSNYPFENSLALTLGGTPVTLTGAGTVTAAANKPFDMPDVQGTFTSSADDVAAVVTSYDFEITNFALAGTCTPKSGAALGTLVLTEGTAPTVTPTPTTTTSATATPTASASASETSTTTEGAPAKGSVDFACALNIGSEFDYRPTISVSGYRENEGDDVSLVATMTDLPGIAPVVIDGPMDFTLDVEVGGEKTTLTSTGDVYADPKEKVAVTDLTGSVDVEGDELEVAVTAFSFDFASAGIGAECEAARAVIGTMTVGTEAPETDDPDSSSSTSPATTTTTSPGSLPKTGGGDALPVLVLWAGALTLFGVAGLLVVPSTSRRRNA